MIALVCRVVMVLVLMESPLTHAVAMLGLLAIAVKQVGCIIIDLLFWNCSIFKTTCTTLSCKITRKFYTDKMCCHIKSFFRTLYD